MDDLLQQLENEPLLPLTKDYWIPTDDQIDKLVKETDVVKRDYLKCCMFRLWAVAQAEANAAIKTQNENRKKQRDEIISKRGEARKAMISTLIRIVLADMSIDPHQRVITWKRTVPVQNDPNDSNDEKAELTADDMEDAYMAFCI